MLPPPLPTTAAGQASAEAKPTWREAEKLPPYSLGGLGAGGRGTAAPRPSPLVAEDTQGQEGISTAAQCEVPAAQTTAGLSLCLAARMKPDQWPPPQRAS